jgi:hypothetical protein
MRTKQKKLKDERMKGRKDERTKEEIGNVTLVAVMKIADVMRGI